MQYRYIKISRINQMSYLTRKKYLSIEILSQKNIIANRIVNDLTKLNNM